MNLYEAHLSSYDHSHKQRLKDMRQLTRDPMASEKARKAEAKANSQSGLISIKLGGDSGGGGGGGFKKAGFKKVGGGFSSAFTPVGEVKSEGEAKKETKREYGVGAGSVGESDTEDEEGAYDPRFPTD